ncbi:MAG: replication-relaxation family protein [Actinomycetota bacterium]|jgi:hypothetical protein
MASDPRELLRELDGRERAILNAIYEHKVLLTEHVKAMFFTSLRRAQDRLRHLARLGLIETWYPLQPRAAGKAPGHHTLAESGAQVVASLLGVARSEIRWAAREAEDREQDRYLAHRLGVNAFFCSLIEAGLEHDGHGLYKWVPERTVRTAAGWLRPDGYGVYLHPQGACDFYFEYDRGTETTRQLANKLAGYVGVARDWTGHETEHFPNLLILVPKLTRERTVSLALTDALARFKNSERLGVPPFFVASEVAVAASGVLGRVWTPIQKLDGRLSIIELPTSKGVSYDLSDCIGRCFTGSEQRWAHLMPLSRRPRFPTGAPPSDDEQDHGEGVVA